MGVISTLKKVNKYENKQILEYFHTCMDSIDDTNQLMLRKVCMYISISYIFLVIAHYLMVDDFRITKAHIMMIPLLVVYFFINVYTRRNPHTLSTNMTGIVCCSFYFIIAVIFSMYDLAPSGKGQTFWLPALILVFPVLYIDRTYKYGIYDLILILMYSGVAYTSKSSERFLRDVYLLLATYVMSMLSAHILLEVRSREGLAVKELRKLSSLDKLTHVMNKGALVSAMETYFMTKPDDEPCAMCIIDLDDFKQVNDNLGHSTGDILLERVGQLLIDNFRAYDIIGRYGGDEFVVLMPKMGDLTILEMRCRTLQMFLTDFSMGNGKPFSVSIGAIISTGVRNYERVFSMADDALYKSKLKGKSRCTTWIVDEKPYTKPILLSVRTINDDRVRKMYAEEGKRFDIVTSGNDDDALCKISQYHQQIKIIFLEFDEDNNIGADVLKYIKTRQGFSGIPVLALAVDEKSSYLAKDLGADEIIVNGADDAAYQEAVKSLVRL